MAKFNAKKAAKALAQDTDFCKGKLEEGYTEEQIVEEFPQFTRCVDFSKIRIQPPQNLIYSALKTAAERSVLLNKIPATEKQCRYLAKLLLDRDHTASDIECGADNSGAMLTIGIASAHIDTYSK